MPIPNPKPGQEITIKINGVPYETIIDGQGTQKFKVNKLIDHLYKRGHIDLNQLSIDCENGLFTKEEYLNLCIGLGYSVSGLFSNFSEFGDLQVENPLW